MKEFFWKDLSGRGFTNTFTQEQLLAAISDTWVDCEECGGKGAREYSARFIDGDLYHDGEILECDFCEGKKQVLDDNSISVWAEQAEIGEEWSDNANKVIRIK